MQTGKSVSSVSIGRMILACATVLIMGGTGLSLAAGPGPDYPPLFSHLLGPTSVKHGDTVQYVFEVTFPHGITVDFPINRGATFSAVTGSITSAGIYTAPATGNRDLVTGKYSGGFPSPTTTQAGRVIALTD